MLPPFLSRFSALCPWPLHTGDACGPGA